MWCNNLYALSIPLFIGALVLGYSRLTKCFRSKLSLVASETSRPPPGPPANWIVGNLLNVPIEQPWIIFTQWKETYGPLVYLHGLGLSILVLNTHETISDFFDKRGNIYSHRPLFTVAGELMGLDNSMPVMPYGNTWRLHRKLAYTVLGAEAVKKYHIVQEDLAVLMCRAILRSPEDFIAHVRLTAGRVVMAVTYGLPVQAADNKYIVQAEETMKVIGKATIPGAYLADLFPSINILPTWIPFMRFRKDGAKGHEMIQELITEPFKHVKEAMTSGTAPSSFTRDLLEDPSTGPGESLSDFENTVRWVAGTMYGAGGESTYATVLTFILAMTFYPEVQRKAQREIDDVIGSARLPLIKDRPSLPYVTAVIKETMRWYPSLPLGFARRSSQDDIYQGYFIPEGTIVIPNVWSLTREGNRYPPNDFVPERFLEDDATLDPYAYAFGFGRRVCPGKYLGENNTFILISSILASFDIAPPINEMGKEVPVMPKFTPGLINYPEQYRCRIVPRSPAKASTIEERAVLAKV